MSHITIDFDQIRDVAHRGVRRAAAFMGLGVHAARDQQFRKYQLSDFTIFRVIPDNLDEKGLTHIKDEFEKWVVSNGLRELVESFGLFLDKVHTACLWMATNKKQLSSEEANKVSPAFKRKGVEEKLNTLRNRFGVSTDKEKYFSSINQARNCITHRKGKVGPEDLRGEKSFRLTWWGFDVVVEIPNRGRILLKPPFPKEGLFFKDGGSMLLDIKDRVMEYMLGDTLIFSPNDLAEVCLLVRGASDDIVKSACEYAKKIGIGVNTARKTIEQNNPGNGE